MKMRKNNNYSGFAAILSFLLIHPLAVGIPYAHAAGAEEEVPTAESALDEQPAEPGYDTGSFHIQPELLLTTYYDDNIYATDRLEVSDKQKQTCGATINIVPKIISS